MATLNLQRFTRAESLRAINPKLLVTFLRPYSDFFLSRSVSLQLDPKGAELDYKRLIDVFMNPDTDTPPDLAEALYFINEMATADGMDQLLDEVESRNVRIDRKQDSTPEDVAIQVWLADREIVEKKHAEQFLHRPKTFEYFQAQEGSRPIGKISSERLNAPEKELDDHFEKKKRGRNTKVFMR